MEEREPVVVYGEDGKVNIWPKNKLGTYTLEIDEGLSGSFASVIMTKDDMRNMVKRLQEVIGE